MTDAMREFLEEASKDKEFSQKVSKADTKEALIALAAEKGFTLTEADMESPKPQDGEISDDEVEAVAGGGMCFCAVGGGGTKGDYDKTCACVLAGAGDGYTHGDKGCRCECAMAGIGDTYDSIIFN